MLRTLFFSECENQFEIYYSLSLDFILALEATNKSL